MKQTSSLILFLLFSLGCSQITVPIPYFNDFETNDGGWTSQGGSNGWNWTVPSSFPAQYGRSWESRDGYYQNSSAISPLFDFTAIHSKVFITFDVANSLNEYYNGYSLFNLEYQTNVTAWTQIVKWPSSRGSWIRITLELPSEVYGRNDVQFRFQLVTGASSSGAVFDNFEISQVPSNSYIACPSINYPLDGSLTVPNNFSFGWNLPITYFLNGVRLYVDTVNPPTKFITVEKISYNLPQFATTQLEAGTYYWRIEPFSSIGTANSTCGVNTFTVVNTPKQTIPYFENFEKGEAGWYPIGNWQFQPNTSCASGTHCWKYVYESGSSRTVNSPIFTVNTNHGIVVTYKLTYIPSYLPSSWSVLEYNLNSQGWESPPDIQKNIIGNIAVITVLKPLVGDLQIRMSQDMDDVSVNEVKYNTKPTLNGVRDLYPASLRYVPISEPDRDHDPAMNINWKYNRTLDAPGLPVKFKVYFGSSRNSMTALSKVYSDVDGYHRSEWINQVFWNEGEVYYWSLAAVGFNGEEVSTPVYSFIVGTGPTSGATILLTSITLIAFLFL